MHESFLHPWRHHHGTDDQPKPAPYDSGQLQPRRDGPMTLTEVLDAIDSKRAEIQNSASAVFYKLDELAKTELPKLRAFATAAESDPLVHEAVLLVEAELPPGVKPLLTLLLHNANPANNAPASQTITGIMAEPPAAPVDVVDQAPAAPVSAT